jgi:SulP family sulfate permease
MFPAAHGYDRQKLIGDLIAGVIVAVMLVPQAMAYSMLAGLPPQIGLYASIIPLILYSLFGSSNALAVGPVAMVSILVATGLRPLAEPGSDQYLQLAITLTFLIALVHLAMAGLRLGFLVNLISHPVLVGFTSAAAIVIAFSQVKHLFGTKVADSQYPIWQIFRTLESLNQLKVPTVLISLMSIAILLSFAYQVSGFLQRCGLSRFAADALAKLGPLVAVLVTSLLIWLAKLSNFDGAGVAIVGTIPAGLPSLQIPGLELGTIQNLFPLALVVTLIGYLESISVAKALANRRNEKVSPNRELVGIGMANLGSAFSGGLPVTGGFSRSLVNHTAGVQTRIGPIVTAAVVALSVIFLTPLFFYVPNAVLAAIIVLAVVRLIDLKTPFQLWKSCRQDALALWITFAAVLLLGIENGILVGIASTFLMLLYRKSRPHIAVVGRVGNSEHFRNYLRYPVEQVEGLLIIRLDEGLSFINASFFESYVLDQINQYPGAHSVLLVASGVNDIDSTGIDSLIETRQALRSRRIELYLSDVKGPVLDRLTLAGIGEEFLAKNIFLSAHAAMLQLGTQKSGK